MARIKVIDEHDATGTLAEVYREITGNRGKLAAVHTIQSLHPESIRGHMSLYKSVMFSRSPLTRPEREMMAVAVSAANGCEYCVEHHAQALDHFWKDRSRVDRLAEQRTGLDGLSERERLLCEYAEAVSTAPGGERVISLQEALKTVGVDDRGILDASLVVSYFNFVNRIVLSLGVELEHDPGGYRYD